MLKMNVESLEALDEPLRALYEPDGEKFKLKVEGLEDTTALRGALQKERKEREAKERQVKAWEKIGKTPDEISELLEVQQQREMTEAERKGEWDKLRAQMNEQHQKELSKKDENLSVMQRLIQSKVIDAEAVSSIAAEGGVPDLLLPHVQRFVKTDDNFNPIVVDASGTPRVDGKGNPMTIRDLVKEMRASEVFGRAFNGSGQSGSGMQPANGGGGTPQIKRKSDLKDRKARAAFVEAHGSPAYFALPE